VLENSLKMIDDLECELTSGTEDEGGEWTAGRGFVSGNTEEVGEDG
jgi:hypothetical protein